MGLIVTTAAGTIDAYFVNTPIDGVQIGAYETPLEHFALMAA